MNKIRLGLVGLGNIGSHHARYLLANKINNCELVAVCDSDPEKLRPYSQVKTFTNSAELIRSKLIDALLVATPHYSHTTIGIDALQQGLHLIVEKPISAHKADAERLLAAHKNKKQVFAVMFNLRPDPCYVKLRQLIRSGDLGEVRRINWLATHWFRSEAYYASGGWRATWAGEGGGALLNQCPHNLDLFQWMFGMPKRVRAFCHLGKHHKIEVEDEVTAYFEFPNGTTAVFITSTGETPGTNRLEVVGEQGKVVLEDGKMIFTRNEIPMTKFSRTSTSNFGRPETWNVQIPFGATSDNSHAEITQNFVDAILNQKPLIAPAEEGIRSLELANAMLLSSFERETIELPLDSKSYEKHLKKLIATSKFKKKNGKFQGASTEDFAKSLHCSERGKQLAKT